MTSRWTVTTPTGEPVFWGTKPMCKAYIKQAIAKGQAADYLKIEANKTAKKAAGK